MLILFVLHYIFIDICHCDNFREIYIEDERDDIINTKVIPKVKQWAPKIWFDPQEKFFPLNVDSFLKEITPEEKNGQKYSDDSYSKLPTGPNSKNYYLITKQNRDTLLKDNKSYLHGVNPTTEEVSIYAHVHTCDTNYDNFIITYWFFYPFNEGKEICTVGNQTPIPVPQIFNRCLGKLRFYGTHVGDWERVSLIIKNGRPTLLFLSVHESGVYYIYDETRESFKLFEAMSEGLGQPSSPPETVQLDDHGHPILFSAKGSHALWAGVGQHQYTKLRLRELSDTVDYGTAWETWHSVQVFYSDETTPEWFNYQGRWGNPGSNCLGLGNFLCEASDGPPGLVTRQPDFSCPPKS
ncbi:uncharacterized protein LOC128982752 [Macrosteles quadrilineatus]|uniref:uncharacterized protein LOC128982752 n=1 Tax=Macrosteles quadrilineatus TaxID=74068 RepID=UPI0023E13093|nr:uncharacterized protein LOC128982752 [Macrosteles quadrilineatus]